MKESIESQNNLIWFLKHYFRYNIIGLEKLKPFYLEKKPFLLVGNHSINFIDPLLLIHSCYDSYHIAPHPIGYTKFFSENPILNSFSELYNIINYRDYKKASSTIKNNIPILVYPGGLEEGLLRNFKEEPYKLKWEKNSAISRFINKFQLPVLFIASIGTDELVTQSSTVKMPSITRKILRMADDVFDQALQMWTVAIHPPIKITHIITDPIYPNEFIDKTNNKFEKSNSVRSTKNLQTICQMRLDTFIAEREKYQDEIGLFIHKFIQDGKNLGL